ncbi:MAG TPA: TonB-dependent receptor [Burkholderiales bacterium]|nr:TonB-dependent receptor [Burkholderiales bacterium]
MLLSGKTVRNTILVFLFSFAFSPAKVFACASCGCTLSSDFQSQGIITSTGFKVDFRFDYLNQNQLRSGTGTISPTVAGKEGYEVELYTKNEYFTLGLDYAPNSTWGINVQIPYIDRDHATLGTDTDGITPGDGAYVSHTSSFGDVKIVGRYQGLLPSKNWGIQLGIKLPTGSYNNVADDGTTLIDPGLQPGTGSTDIIVGSYYHDSLSQNWGYFGSVAYQVAVESRAEYRPGNSVNLSAGVNYFAFAYVTPQLQINFRHVATDSGALADTVSTGGTLVYVSPGFFAPVTKKVAVYGFVQLPIYQDLTGVQLAPRYVISLGTRFSF